MKLKFLAPQTEVVTVFDGKKILTTQVYRQFRELHYWCDEQNQWVKIETVGYDNYDEAVKNKDQEKW